MKDKGRNESGITLITLIITVLILGILLGIVEIFEADDIINTTEDTVNKTDSTIIEQRNRIEQIKDDYVEIPSEVVN